MLPCTSEGGFFVCWQRGYNGIAMRLSSRLADYILRKPEVVTGLHEPTAIDLFSGAGGITLGALNAGFNVLLSADLDEACALTHRRNFAHIPFLQTDISGLSGNEILARTGIRTGELDLLIGGPPCQGFSIMGQREVQDPRNRLFGDFLRIAAELKPKCIVIENVPGLATLGKGALLRKIGATFENAGYNAECAELLAAQYGVPQMRWRMFFVAWREDQCKAGGFPLPTHGNAGIGDLVPNRTITKSELDGFLTIEDAIGDLPRIEAGESGSRYTKAPKRDFQQAMRYGASAEVHNHYAARLSQQNLARIRVLNPGEDWRSLPRALLPAGMKRALRKDHTRRYRRMQWHGVARSVITRFRDPKSGEYTHPEQHRTISIREAARIQSFPDWFVFEGTISQQYDQVGNAVPPLLARAVVAELRRVLESTKVSTRQVVSRAIEFRQERMYLFSPQSEMAKSKGGPGAGSNFVSEWFGHRIYPDIVASEEAIREQQAEQCPFLSGALGESRKCIKADAAKGVCTISSPSNGVRQDWLVCPYRALSDELVSQSIRQLFALSDTSHPLVLPAATLSKPDVRRAIEAQLNTNRPVFLYFDKKTSGELSIPATKRSPEFAFDVTVVELTLKNGHPHIGRFGILEIQTMDFHGSYRNAVRNLREGLRMHPGTFADVVQANQWWLADGVEGPNIANVFKRTFYQMMFKFELGRHARCVGCVLAIPKAVWDSWQRHLGAPELSVEADGTYRLLTPGRINRTRVPRGSMYSSPIHHQASPHPRLERTRSSGPMLRRSRIRRSRSRHLLHCRISMLKPDSSRPCRDVSSSSGPN